MNLNEISEKLSKVSDIYAAKFGIQRDNDWFILKIQEELGELSSAYLKLTQRGRIGQNSQADLNKNLRDEIADVVAMTLLFARHHGVDVEQALKDKWFNKL
jgi:NTP pyrophosphatase (non-canonical NTP hydrolase)